MTTTKKKATKRKTKNQFTKGNTASKGFGRPKMTEEEKELSLQTRTQFKNIINKYMIHNKAELRKIYRAAKTPALDCMIIKSILNALEKGDQSMINWFANHVLGKEKEVAHVHLSGGTENNTSINVNDLTKEELLAIKEMHNKQKKGNNE